MEISDILKQSRYDAGKSQAYVATKLGVSKNTVQNWESGYSTPDIANAIEWFKILDLPVIPYYLRYMYPSLDVSPKDDDDKIQEALIECIMSATPEMQRKLLYLFFGDHGSSPKGVVEMMTAHLHVPLKDRLNIASAVITNYEVAEATDTLIGQDYIQPDMNVLINSFESAKEAVKQKGNRY